jgi:hypothetical protein
VTQTNIAALSSGENCGKERQNSEFIRIDRCDPCVFRIRTEIPQAPNSTGDLPMKKIITTAMLLLVTSTAFASARPCRAWRTRHHHRVCVKH